jgi:hypothetical protein
MFELYKMAGKDVDVQWTETFRRKDLETFSKLNEF